MDHSFAITYDYLCPFARNANEAVAQMLTQGAAFDVSFIPFSLAEGHAEPGDVAQWDLPTDQLGSGVLALLWSIAVREHFPSAFLDFHIALFSARHDDGEDINDPLVIEQVTIQVDLDPTEVRTIVESGVPAKLLAVEHSNAVADHDVFGVPTFIQGDEAVFVRFMERRNTEDLERVLQLISWTNLNEFKRTTVRQ